MAKKKISWYLCDGCGMKSEPGKGLNDQGWEIWSHYHAGADEYHSGEGGHQFCPSCAPKLVKRHLEDPDGYGCEFVEADS